jgi:hypothetical protein
MEQQLQKTEFVIQAINDIIAGNYDKTLNRRRVENEKFNYWTFGHENYKRNVISFFSCDFIPDKIYIFSIDETKESVATVLGIFTKMNRHFIWAVGQIGYNNDDFVNKTITIEILVDIEQTKQLRK